MHVTREPERNTGSLILSYPHLAVPDGGAVLRQPQDVQVHVVLSPSPQAEAETLVVPLEVHGVELGLLGRAGETRPSRRRGNRLVARGRGQGVKSKLQDELPQRWQNIHGGAIDLNACIINATRGRRARITERGRREGRLKGTTSQIGSLQV